MNKIKVNNQEHVIYQELIIKDNSDEEVINIQDDTKLFYQLMNSNNELIYNVSKNIDLTFNCLAVNTSCHITFNLEEGSKIIFNLSLIGKNDNTCIIEINHNGKDITSIINNKGINLGNKLTFIVNSEISKESTGCKTDQNSSIILFDNKGEVLPNLIIDNNDVIANHASYVGKFKKNWLFYLESRGINQEKSYEMLSKAFLIGHMSLNYNEIASCLKIIDDYWR